MGAGLSGFTVAFLLLLLGMNVAMPVLGALLVLVLVPVMTLSGAMLGWILWARARDPRYQAAVVADPRPPAPNAEAPRVNLPRVIPPEDRYGEGSIAAWWFVPTFLGLLPLGFVISRLAGSAIEVGVAVSSGGPELVFPFAMATVLVATALALFAIWVPIESSSSAALAVARAAVRTTGIVTACAGSALFWVVLVLPPAVVGAVVWSCYGLSGCVGAVLGWRAWSKAQRHRLVDHHQRLVVAHAAAAPALGALGMNLPRTIFSENRFWTWGLLTLPACLGLIWLAFYLGFVTCRDQPVYGWIGALFGGLLLLSGTPQCSRLRLVATVRGAVLGAGLYGFAVGPLQALALGMVELDWVVWLTPRVWVLGPVMAIAGAVCGWRLWARARDPGYPTAS